MHQHVEDNMSIKFDCCVPKTRVQTEEMTRVSEAGYHWMTP